MWAMRAGCVTAQRHALKVRVARDDSSSDYIFVHGSATTGLKPAGVQQRNREQTRGPGLVFASQPHIRALGRCTGSELTAQHSSAPLVSALALRGTARFYGRYALNSAVDAAPPFAPQAASARRATPDNPRATRGKQLRNAR